MKVAGVIDSITSKTVSNGGTVYTAVIDGTEVNLGFQCNYKEGEYAEIEVEQTKWGLQVPRNPQKGKPATGATNRQAPANVSGSPRPSNKQFPVNPDSKDHIIIRQNALTNANAAVRAVVDSGVASFDSPDDIYNEIIKVAYNFTGFSMGTLDSKLIEAANKAQAEAVAKAVEPMPDLPAPEVDPNA